MNDLHIFRIDPSDYCAVWNGSTFKKEIWHTTCCTISIITQVRLLTVNPCTYSIVFLPVWTYMPSVWLFYYFGVNNNSRWSSRHNHVTEHLCCSTSIWVGYLMVERSILKIPTIYLRLVNREFHSLSLRVSHVYGQQMTTEWTSGAMSALPNCPSPCWLNHQQ